MRLSGVCRGEPVGVARTRLQAGWTLVKIALYPLVAALAADAVQLRKLCYRKRLPKKVGDKVCSLVHG